MSYFTETRDFEERATYGPNIETSRVPSYRRSEVLGGRRDGMYILSTFKDRNYMLNVFRGKVNIFEFDSNGVKIDHKEGRVPSLDKVVDDLKFVDEILHKPDGGLPN